MKYFQNVNSRKRYKVPFQNKLKRGAGGVSLSLAVVTTHIFAVLYFSKPGSRTGSLDPARQLGLGLSCLTSDG